MPDLKLSFASGEKSLDVRGFAIQEGMSQLFEVSVVALSESAELDLESLVGKAATFRARSGVEYLSRYKRRWKGVVSYIEQIGVEPVETGLSTYAVTIVPDLWLLTQRCNYRVFQHLSIPDIVEKVLAEWKIENSWTVDRGAYPKLSYKAQYGETDYAFVCRLLEEAGISFWFSDSESKDTILTLHDYPAGSEPHEASPVRFVDEPNQAAQKEFITQIHMSHSVRPGAYAIRDYDFRNPGYPLFGNAPRAQMPEGTYELYHYRPGGFLAETGKGGNTPVADDKGAARSDEQLGAKLVERRLASERAGKREVSFRTNVFGLRPGIVFEIENHPHPALAQSERLLITHFRLEGQVTTEWIMSGRAVFTKDPYRPPIVTPKPEVKGVQSAVVTGPPGEEIHTDEFGRVRVQFPWDREGKNDDNSSCWVHVSQGWAGMGFGAICIPRIGQEVLVAFLGGDPDQPIIVGRAFNGTNVVPYVLPTHKTRSVWKTQSSPGGDGYNELLFEDAKDQELIYMQAQKNLRRLVKNDETITVSHDRQKLVKNDELEKTGANRAEVTVGSRIELTQADRKTVVRGDNAKLVKHTELEHVYEDHHLHVGQNQEIVVEQVKKEGIGGSSHLYILGDQRRKVDGADSLTVGGDQDEKVQGSHALEAGREVHIKAGTKLVLEGAMDLTLKGPGGFVRIDPSGVTIMGTLVRINSGGAAGSGKGASPKIPEQARAVIVDEPEVPEPDDVNETWLGQ